MARLGLKALLRACLGDLAQRVLTGNKFNQKSRLLGLLRGLALPAGSRVLDFGCGTGVFAPLFARAGFGYTGFDIDPASLDYARLLHSPPASFTHSLDEAATQGPYGCILANCCFHHIPTEELHGLLGRLRAMLAPGGVFLLVDILAVENDPSPLHRWFMTLEQGRHVRPRREYEEIVAGHFRIARSGVYRDNILSIPVGRIPIGNDLLFLECRP